MANSIDSNSPRNSLFALAAMLLACTVAPLLAYNLTPSATLFNQLTAVAGWGLVLVCLGRSQPRWQGGAAVWALLLLLAAPCLSWLTGLPMSLALSGSAMITAALLVLLAGQGLDDQARLNWFEIFCWSLLAAGLLSLLVSLVQVFAPDWADGQIIARSGIPGRAVGNLRQPNHLASLLMWSCVAAVYLAEGGRLKKIGGAIALPALLLGLVLAVVLSASRTGMLAVLILAFWGALDRKLSRASKLSLLATPLMLVLCWWLISFWANAGGHAFGAESRLAEGAGSPSRLAILANAWELLKSNPLTGVGWGQFNLAWSMSPFPQRPIAFFDHTHNLPMQLAVELGLPLSLTVLGLLGWALWAAFSIKAQGQEALMRRCAFMLVLMIGLHSLLEYPLWYAYFLLPTAFAFGIALGRPGPRSRSLAQALPLAGLLMLAGSIYSVAEYLRIVDIYVPSANAQPLEQRIAVGQRTLLFSTHADYAAATSLAPGLAALNAAKRTAHSLIDARLMESWAKSLHASGDDERARYVVQRLREFRNPIGDEFLAGCAQPAEKPFQCEMPTRSFSWREMR